MQEGRTAIHYAALSGYAEAVRMLAANGCDVNTRDNVSARLHSAMYCNISGVCTCRKVESENTTYTCTCT